MYWSSDVASSILSGPHSCRHGLVQSPTTFPGPRAITTGQEPSEPANLDPSQPVHSSQSEPDAPAVTHAPQRPPRFSRPPKCKTPLEFSVRRIERTQKNPAERSEENKSEHQSLIRNTHTVSGLKQKNYISHNTIK